jgi:preprotein translocase subunit SecG
MYTFFVVLIVLVSLLMIGIVLIQESKGGGLASNFSASNAIMGVRKTTDFIEKATWTLAALMVIFSVVCAYTTPQAASSETVLERNATETQTTNPTNTPGFQAGQQDDQAGAQKAAPKAGNAAPAQAPAAPKAPVTPAK